MQITTPSKKNSSLFALVAMATAISACGNKVDRASIDQFQTTTQAMQTATRNNHTAITLSFAQSQAVNAQMAYSEDGLKSLKTAWGDLDADAFTKDQMNAAIMAAQKKHVQPQANKFWPSYSGIISLLRNSEPAFEVVSAGFLRDTLAARTDVKIVPIVNGQDPAWATGADLAKLDKSTLVVVARDTLVDAVKVKKNFGAMAKEETVVYAALKNIDPQQSALTRVSPKFLNAEAPPAPYFTIIATMGYLSGMDPHSYLISDKSNSDRMSSTKSLVGIGVGLQKTPSGAYQITKAIKGGPAAEGKVMAGDIIVSVNGKNTADYKDLDAMVSDIKGAAGTSVTMVFSRGDKQFSAAITRRAVSYSDVDVTPNFDAASGSPLVQLGGYSSGISDLIREGATAAGAAKKDFWIFDLRGNGGGLVNEAVSLVESLAPTNFANDTVFYTFNGRSFDQGYQISPTQDVGPKNIILLTDAGSASASEVTTQNLKHFGNTFIVGTRTYGKGSMQTMQKVGDGLQMAVTVGLYFTDGNGTPQFTGVKPNFDTTSLRKDMLSLNPEDNVYESDMPGALNPIKGKGDAEAFPDNYPKTAQCLNDLASSGKLISADDLKTPQGVQYGIEAQIAIKAIGCEQTTGEARR